MTACWKIRGELGRKWDLSGRSGEYARVEWEGF